MAIAFISHAICELHDMGQGHPERPERLSAIRSQLQSAGMTDLLDIHEAPLASSDLLERVHAPAYLEQIRSVAPEQGSIWLDGDTAMNPHSLEAALRAAGALELAVDLVMDDRARKVFCAVRPPGHHAEGARAMGFCLFNNVVAGARCALDRYGLERVAILDFDVHHGNGTEDIVAGDERILFCSTFQHPFYPHSGVDCGAANVVNTPLASGAGGREFREAVERDWLPRLAGFAPELVLVSAGFDAHRDDSMAGLEFVDEDYAWIGGVLCEVAETSAGGRMISTLEGGYELGALARSVELYLRAQLEFC